MTDEEIIAGFNGWIEQGMKDPEGFEAIDSVKSKHLEEKAEGKPASYGERCLACLKKYSKEGG